MKHEELAKIVRDTTGSHWFVPHRHIRCACRIIEDDEIILAAAPCGYEKKSGLFIVSKMRLFFVSGAVFGAIHVKELPPKSVKAISYNYGLFSGSISLTLSRDELSIDGLPKSGIMCLANAIRKITSYSRGNDAVGTEEPDVVRLVEYGPDDPEACSHLTLVEALDDTG
jgi:hypothetical protein